MILDTHMVFWLAEAPEELSRNAFEAIRSERQAGRLLGISDQTLWELAMMIRRGRVVAQGSLRDFLETVESRFAVHSLSAAIAEQAQMFSERFPRDPRDRIIAATAIVLGQPLITADRQIRSSGEVSCIW